MLNVVVTDAPRADLAQVDKLAQPLAKSGYGQYLLRLLKDERNV